jgi:hypothetical protein
MTDRENKENHHYIGDGIYLELDSRQIILRTEDSRNDFCTNIIFIEYPELDLINKLVNDFKEKKDELPE